VRNPAVFASKFKLDYSAGDASAPHQVQSVEFYFLLIFFSTVIVDEGIVFTAEKVNALFTPSHEAIAAIIALGEATSPTDAQPLMQKLVTILVANAGDITAWADSTYLLEPRFRDLHGALSAIPAAGRSEWKMTSSLFIPTFLQETWPPPRIHQQRTRALHPILWEAQIQIWNHPKIRSRVLVPTPV
jgi:hypothetical protein